MPTTEELLKQIEELKAALNKKNTLSIKIGEKGGVSVYGLGRFPVSLYGEQWIRLAEYMPTVTTFIKANQSKLSTKADRDARKAAEKSA